MPNSDIDDIDEIDEVDEIVREADHGDRILRPVRHRVDPLDLPDSYFKSRFRFSKNGVRRLVDLVRPNLNLNEDNPNARRGQPFSAEQIVCSALNIMGGGHFQRVQGDCTGSVPSTAHKFLYKFVDALLPLKEQFLHVPTKAEMRQNMALVKDKYGLSNVICGIDGSHCAFDGKPRGIPAGRPPVQFINRKKYNSLNVLITAGITHKMYDIIVTAPGSFHDAGIYNQSMIKGWLGK